MRRVKYYSYITFRKDGISKNQKVVDGEADFHTWGVNYEEFESGPGNYSTAIIELDSGEIMNIEAEMIEFIK